MNTPFLNKYLNEYIEEKQSFLKDLHCDTQRRVCQTCLKQTCNLHKINFVSSTPNEINHSNQLLSLHAENWNYSNYNGKKIFYILFYLLK